MEGGLRVQVAELFNGERSGGASGRVVQWREVWGHKWPTCSMEGGLRVQAAGCSMEGVLRVQVAELFNGGRFEDASG